MNNTNTQNHIEDAYWVVMEPASPIVTGMNHVLLVATSTAQAVASAQASHGANGWRCLFGGTLKEIVDLINKVEHDPKFYRSRNLDWFLTVIEDRATNNREGVMIVAKNPHQARKAVWRDIRSRHAEEGRFVVLALLGSEHLAVPLKGLLAELNARANACN
jgi:hypothetical protein